MPRNNLAEHSMGCVVSDLDSQVVGAAEVLESEVSAAGGAAVGSHLGWVVAALRLVVALGLMAVLMVGFGAVCVLLLPWRALRIRLSGRVGHLVGWGVMRIFGVRVSVEGVVPEGGALFVVNHTSHLDMFLAAAVAPVGVCFIGRRGVLLLPFFGVLYALSGHLLIPRGRTKAAIEAMKRQASLVRREGLGMWIWPEGTRSGDGRLRSSFKKGFVHLAIEAGLPVAPVIFEGAHRVWPKGRFLARPGEVVVRFLAPVETGGWRAESAAEHAAQIHTQMAAAMPADQAPAR